MVLKLYHIVSPYHFILHNNMFQQNLNEIFKDLSNVFGIADDISVVVYGTEWQRS